MPTKTSANHRGARWALMMLAGSASAFAADERDPYASAQDAPSSRNFIPYSSAQAEYNSNLFDLPDGQQAAAQNSGGESGSAGTTGIALVDDVFPGSTPPSESAAGAGGNDPARADTQRRYAAGIAGSLPWGDQKLRGTIEGRRLDYSQFSHLNHDEYLLSGGMDWRLSSSLDGALNYRQEQRMASFADRRTTELTMEEERIASASLNLHLGSSWRLETGLQSRNLDSPLPGFPEFRLKENTLSTAIKYLVADRLTAGIYTDYLSGQFDGIPNAGKFRQTGLGLVVDSSLGSFSRLSAQLGYARREDDVSGSLSAMTGLLSYHRELTVKTSVDALAFRRIGSYAGSASSVQETGAGTTLAWKATQKMSLTGSYQWVEGDFEESALSGAAQRRKDTSHIASVNLAYQMLPWLALRPYYGFRSRDSSVEFNNYDAKIVGVELRAHFL